MNKIYYNQLPQTLKQPLVPIWLVFGDEPWQKNDALSQIKQASEQAGFSELIRFSADDKFDWRQVADEYQAMSLFASQRIIEIELVNGKVSEQGNKLLMELCHQLHQDTLLLFHGPRLDAATTNRKWFKSLQQHGCYVPVYEIEGQHLHRWLQQQAKNLSLGLSPGVSELLTDLFEGNLPALAQELQKLAIIYPNQHISLSAAEQLVINQAKFNPFQLIDAVLQNNLPRAIKVIDQLQHEGAAAGQLLWFLHKEATLLLQMHDQLANGESQANIFKSFRIWDKRKPSYQQALANISAANLKHTLSRIADIDLLLKTNSELNPFVLIADICASFYYGERTKEFHLNYEQI